MELLRQAPELRAGERWQMNVRLKAPHGNSNPHGFDYELWLWEQGLQATGYVRAGPQRPAAATAGGHLAPPGGAGPPGRCAMPCSSGWPTARTAGLLAALIVGDQNAIDRADWDVFRATGVAHLMSISGLHVTMFAWAAALLVGALWRRSQRLCLAWPAQHAALVGGVLLATGYALFSGWGVPGAAHDLDAGGGRPAAPVGPALALAAGVAAGLRRGRHRRSLGPDAARLLAELRGGGRAVRDRPGPARGRGVPARSSAQRHALARCCASSGSSRWR